MVTAAAVITPAGLLHATAMDVATLAAITAGEVVEAGRAAAGPHTAAATVVTADAATDMVAVAAGPQATGAAAAASRRRPRKNTDRYAAMALKMIGTATTPTAFLAFTKRTMLPRRAS